MERDNPSEESGLDPEFPSGPWKGFYLYGGNHSRHRMDLNLTFRDGILQGDGTDDIGYFAIRGHYDRETKKTEWRKSYPGSHDVYYGGFRDGKGIWGTWKIEVTFLGMRLRESGGFHIWPGGGGIAVDANAEAAVHV